MISPRDDDASVMDVQMEAGDAAHSGALFAGDHGALSLDTRRALVLLLLGPALDARRHAKLWTVMLRDEAVLRSRLSELFLELVIDPDQKVAFTRQIDVGALDAPILLRRSQLTFIDSVLLLHLRHRLAHASAHGERAAVSVEEMLDHLSLYERSANTDRAGFAKRAQASIEKFKKHSILQKIRNSDGRYEISPTLKLLFDAEQIQALTAVYGALADTASPDTFSVPPEAREED